MWPLLAQHLAQLVELLGFVELLLGFAVLLLGFVGQLLDQLEPCHMLPELQLSQTAGHSPHVLRLAKLDRQHLLLIIESHRQFEM
jgi:hypothetical protein